MSLSVYLVLLHHPITNRHGQTVTTAITNMDIHDISRTAKTYGLKNYFLVTPILDQHELVGRILEHWSTDRSKKYHPDRFEALSLVRLAHTFDDVKEAIFKDIGQYPEVVLTDARLMEGQMSYQDYRGELEKRALDPQAKPVLLAFGTGWGISPEFYPEIHRKLQPIWGPGRENGYNHLSVRSAVATILDRLFGI